MSVSRAPAFDFLSRPVAPPAKDPDVVASAHPGTAASRAPRKKVRVCIFVDEGLRDEVAAAAAGVGISRSAAFSQAARKWLSEVDELVPVAMR